MGSCASKAPTDKVILPKPNSCQCHLMESPDKETDSMISIQQDKTCLNCYRMHRLDFKCGSYRRIKSSDTSSVSQGTQTDIPPPNRKSRHRKIEGKPYIQLYLSNIMLKCIGVKTKVQ
ncbi:uncharacterized protein LOC118765165 [Octopus sinensis]|uniref:Uncharacterized protein LOC118765165 n=1 Tax=Octopus sinensis TaxID=2607531 RepID=A0A7E6F5W2_9MOLL|nr:uncharacterized protein LOC118765165 [Octopus sinensis]